MTSLRLPAPSTAAMSKNPALPSSVRMRSHRVAANELSYATMAIDKAALRLKAFRPI